MSFSENKSQMRASSERLSVALAADLMERLGHGSTLYRTTWKAHTTPSGRSLLRARSVGRPISETDCTGWPTCTALDRPRTPETLVAGWVSPQAADGHGAGINQNTASLDKQARALTGWNTPSVDNFRSRSGDRKDEMGNDQLVRTLPMAPGGPARITAHGTLLTGSGAGTVSGGQLNPDLSRWLMGLPEEWARSMPGWQDWQMWQVLTALVSSEPKPTE